MNSRIVRLEDLRQLWRMTNPDIGLLPTDPESPSLAAPSVAVIGACGGAGATTLALSLAEHLPNSRVLECRTSPVSSLAGATTSELGRFIEGWTMGSREGDHERVVIQRAPQAVTSPSHLPPPIEPGDCNGVTIIDVGWRLPELSGWLAIGVGEATTVIVVAPGTCPGLTHLEATLRDLEERTTSPITVALRGPHLKRWPRPLRATAGPRALRLIDAGQLVAITEDRTLHLMGLTPAPLPRAVTAAGADLARHIEPTLSPVLAASEATRHQVLPFERTRS